MADIVTKIRVDRQGRLVVPAEVRKAMGIAEGSVLVAHLGSGGELTLEESRSAARRLRGSLKGLVAPGRSLVDELIEDRREEAAREEAAREETDDRTAHGGRPAIKSPPNSDG